MKELYLAMAVLCFLAAVIVNYVNKSVQILKELRDTWKNYKQSQEEILDSIRKNKDEID